MWRAAWIRLEINKNNNKLCGKCLQLSEKINIFDWNTYLLEKLKTMRHSLLNISLLQNWYIYFVWEKKLKSNHQKNWSESYMEQ